MSPDYSKRGYLLPKGCKDLIDVINLAGKDHAHVPLPPGAPSAPKPELLVPPSTTVGTLASMLGEPPFKLIADLMKFGIFACVQQPLSFDMICQLARKYGFVVKRA